MVIGALAAAQILMLIPSRDGFSLLFAGLILAAVALSLARWRVRPTRRSLLVAGTLSGLMGTVTTIGAPPMGIVYQHAPGARTRGTLNAFFALGALVSLGALTSGQDFGGASSYFYRFGRFFICGQPRLSRLGGRFGPRLIEGQKRMEMRLGDAGPFESRLGQINRRELSGPQSIAGGLNREIGWIAHESPSTGGTRK